MKIVILGAGLTGLAAGMELSKKHDITVLEKKDYIGGLASSYKVKWQGKNYSIPVNYHHILEDDVSTKQVIRGLGLWNSFYTKKIKFAFHVDGRFIRLSSPMGFLRFPAPFLEKVRFGMTVLGTSRRKDWGAWEEYNAKEYVEGKIGKTIYKRLIRPLQAFKFGGNPDSMSAAWMLNRLGSESKNFLKKFGYLDGGLNQMIEEMVAEIEKNGGWVAKDCNVVKLNRHGNKIESVEYIQNGKKRKLECDILVSTIPLLSIVKLAGLKGKRLKKVKYRGSICVTYGMRKKVSQYYWMMFLDGKYDFGAAFEHTNLYPDAAPEGKAVFYAVKYTDQNDSLWGKTDERIGKMFSRQLDDVFKGFSKNVEWTRVFREMFSEPVYEKEYKDYKPSMRTEIKNLYLAGMPFIFPKIRNMSNAIESGWDVAKLVRR
jgi:protoporphyrinogen oxidase